MIIIIIIIIKKNTGAYCFLKGLCYGQFHNSVLGWAEIYKTSILSHLSSYIKIKEISNDSVNRENSA